MNHLGIILKFAEKRGLIRRAPHIERPRKPPPLDRYLTQAQFDRLLDACKAPHLKLFCLLAIGTAARKEALLTLTWDRILFDRHLIALGHPTAIRPQKGRATVPMTDTLRAALSEAPTGARTDYVIEYGGRAVTRLARSGSTESEIAAITGHSTSDVRSILDRHYLSREVELAEEAMRKREQKEGGTNAVKQFVKRSSRSSQSGGDDPQ